MNAATTTDNGVATEDAGILIGDHYDQTAEWTIAQVAEALHGDLLAVQGDDMLPAEAEFAVTTDTSGRQDLLRVTISALHHDEDAEYDEDTEDTYAFATDRTRAALVSVFSLASNYNRVDPAHVDQARFVLVIELADDDGNSRPALVGVMQDVRPVPPLNGGACPTCGHHDTVDEEPATAFA